MALWVETAQCFRCIWVVPSIGLAQGEGRIQPQQCLFSPGAIQLISPASHQQNLPAGAGLGCARWVDLLLKPLLAHFRAQTCPGCSALALVDRNNTESSSTALCQELYHSVLFNRKCMSVFICLLALRLSELLSFRAFSSTLKIRHSLKRKSLVDHLAPETGGLRQQMLQD